MADDTKEMLRTILNNLSTFKQEMLKKFDKVDKRFDDMDAKFTGKIDKHDEKLTKRLDSIGNQLAYLEDDAPTREEFNDLEKRVDNIEQTSRTSTT